MGTKYIKLIALSLSLTLLGFYSCKTIKKEQTVKSNFGSWATTPTMGWNSYNCFGGNVTEAEVKANADYMANNLKQYGWEYIVVDFLWFCDDQDRKSVV